MIAMATIGVWAILRWGVYGTMAGQAMSAAILSLVLWSTWLRWSREPGAGAQASSVSGSEQSKAGVA
jgi:hypothetical protein